METLGPSLPNADRPDRIEAIVPNGAGHQFVFYGDACSGVAGAPHAATFAETNAAVSRLDPPPEFVVFAGDEVIGLTTDEAELRSQWDYWLGVEMAWLDRDQVPLYNTTSNHTTYNEMSETVFAGVLGHLPKNGPPRQLGLSYHVRRDDLLLVFINTCWSQLGGEGHVETEWLDSVLAEHSNARHKLVVGHHPVFPVNGFAGERQRELGSTDGRELWRVLRNHRVIAYLCSHILAFDVQVHDGVLQVVSAGAGTAYRMPEGIEYLHFVQAAIDDRGLRYQVVDQAGSVRERLDWPVDLGPSSGWEPLLDDEPDKPPAPYGAVGSGDDMVGLRLRGKAPVGEDGRPQTILSTRPGAGALPSVWIGLTGRSQRLTVTIGPEPGRSPHYWFGPEFEPGEAFDFQLALHYGMGPGGIMHRYNDDEGWTSLTSSSPWGLERTRRSDLWTIGHTAGPSRTAEFRGNDLSVLQTPAPTKPH